MTTTFDCKLPRNFADRQVQPCQPYSSSGFKLFEKFRKRSPLFCRPKKQKNSIKSNKKCFYVRNFTSYQNKTFPVYWEKTMKVLFLDFWNCEQITPPTRRILFIDITGQSFVFFFCFNNQCHLILFSHCYVY